MMHQARKRFGQNFLQDSGVIYSIVAAINPNENMHVIEIGPGLGALTRPLLSNLEHLDLLEIDRDLVAYWNQENLKGLNVIEGDALKFNFLEWANARPANSGLCKVVGNLPYNISSHYYSISFLLPMQLMSRYSCYKLKWLSAWSLRRADPNSVGFPLCCKRATIWS
jgi:16S rRNA A1518/A1519 N6-dimethyltransferase RsmA/KsgA/DIM1 with predicted DNA glycosylase/AP lyase activity